MDKILERKNYLKKIKKEKIFIKMIQIFILISFILAWQILSDLNIINSFLCSSPTKVFKTILELIHSNELISNIIITFKEIIISFLLSSLIAITIAIILWYFPIINKIIEPYLTILNSLPKVALGPIIIIWAGANNKSIILMSLLISTFSTIISIYISFMNTNKTYIRLLKSMKASKLKILIYSVIPSNINTIISSLKINLSMTFVGVIMGELLVSKQGLGYLINYGSQVFNTNLVITSIIILCILTSILYLVIVIIEKKIKETH